jgi:putative transcription antitermination factor YqgF
MNAVRWPVVLGIDYGLQRVGVAITRGALAEPLLVLSQDDALLAELQKIITAERVEKVVVGLSEKTMAELAMAFGQELQHVLPPEVTVEYVDETLSSKEVEHRLRQAPLSKKRGKIDHYAAAIILERWLEEHEGAE